VFSIEGPGTILEKHGFARMTRDGLHSVVAGEQLFLDTTTHSDASAVLRSSGPTLRFATSLGTFQRQPSYRNLIGSLLLEKGTLARGVGVVASEQDLLTGRRADSSKAERCRGLPCRRSALPLQNRIRSKSAYENLT